MPIPILTGAAMRGADDETISELGIPGFTLMETAGRATADAISSLIQPVQERAFGVLCGRGNNGGDGLVIARRLALEGGRVIVMMLGKEDDLSADASTNLSILRKLIELDPSLDAEVLQYESEDSLDALASCDVLVDALLGTGIESEVREPIRSIVTWINQLDAAVVSVDIPTGLSTDTGRVLGAAVEADLTVTMAAMKVGQLVNDGPKHTGWLEVAEIGIPPVVLEKHAVSDGCAWTTTDEEVTGWFSPRASQAHKYSAGTVVSALGSKKFPGAAVMASTAASRIGAGYVICGAPKSIQDTLASRLTDVTIVPLKETVDGGIAASARQGLEERLSRATAILIGCGVGRESDTLTFVREMIDKAEVPGVIDADGLYALSKDKDVLRKPKGKEWILTPHWGEFRMLVGQDDLDGTDRVRLASRYAREWGSVLLLKGMPSIVGCPDGRVFINRTGNTGVATAGTGDVLAGFCAGLLAQGMPPVEAAVSGLHIGGAAADLFAARADSRTLVATDLIDLIPETVKVRFSTGSS
jgi:NAD(P)H-hydrate epimerase